MNSTEYETKETAQEVPPWERCCEGVEGAGRGLGRGKFNRFYGVSNFTLIFSRGINLDTKNILIFILTYFTYFLFFIASTP